MKQSEERNVKVEMVDDEEEEPEPLDPQLYRASSSALMRYAEEELIREEEHCRLLERKHKSHVHQNKRPLFIKDTSSQHEVRSNDNGYFFNKKVKGLNR